MTRAHVMHLYIDPPPRVLHLSVVATGFDLGGHMDHNSMYRHHVDTHTRGGGKHMHGAGSHVHGL